MDNLHLACFIWWLILDLADGATTYLALRNPLNYESNRWLATLMARIGVVPALLVVKLGIIMLVWPVVYLMPLPVWVGLDILYTLVVANNIRVKNGRDGLFQIAAEKWKNFANTPKD